MSSNESFEVRYLRTIRKLNDKYERFKTKRRSESEPDRMLDREEIKELDFSNSKNFRTAFNYASKNGD